MEPVEIVEEKGGANAFRDAKDKVEEASEDSRGAAGRDEKGMTVDDLVFAVVTSSKTDDSNIAGVLDDVL